MASDIDLGVTVTIVLSLITIAVAVIISDVFGKYEKKVFQIKTALLGFLQREVNRLVIEEIDKRELKVNTPSSLEISEQEVYTNLITFFRESHLFSYANDYEEMLYFERHGEGKINKLAFSIGAFSVPVFLLQKEESLYLVGTLWLFFNLIFFIFYSLDVKNMICKIKSLYSNYIIDNQSFGGYDL